MEIKNKVCNHDIVTKFGVAECQNCGIEESEILKDKQMYSEKEVLKILYNYNEASNFPLEKDDIINWFKQFKK